MGHHRKSKDVHHLPRDLHYTISEQLGETHIVTSTPQELPQKSGRVYCPRNKDRKVNSVCKTNGKHMCSEHSNTLCKIVVYYYYFQLE